MFIAITSLIQGITFSLGIIRPVSLWGGVNGGIMTHSYGIDIGGMTGIGGIDIIHTFTSRGGIIIHGGIGLQL